MRKSDLRRIVEKKIVVAISEMMITIILLLTDKVQKVLTQTLFRE